MARWFESFSMPSLWRRRQVSLADTIKAGEITREPRERGATGTPNYGGYITGEDYNPKLDGKAALKVYDEMRRSDAQVKASLLVLKLPLLSASYTVQPPDGADAEEQAIADFVKAALFEDGAMADPWHFVLQHILLMLDFGFSLFEKVFVVAADGTLRLHRLAPRLPTTIERWIPDERGMLREIEQWATTPRGLETLRIPAEYAVVFVHDREGDNWFGRSVLRSAYKHWFYKNEAYRIDAIRLYRYGVGIPMASIGRTYSPKADELTRIDDTLKSVATHERAYIRTHEDVAFSILVPQGGRGGATELMESVDHHNLMIARNVLAHFMQEGPEGLNSSRTRTFADLFTAALYAVADNITSTLNARVVKPLCDLNFVMSGRRYPKIQTGDVADVDVKELVANVQRLGFGRFLTPDDDLEVFLRDLMGLTPLPESLKGRDRTPPATPGQPPPLRRPTPAAAIHAARRAPVELGGRFYGRYPTPFEQQVLSLAEVPDTLERESAALAADLTAIRREQLRTLAAQIAKKDARPTGPFTDLRPDEFSIPERTAVERAIRATQRRVVTFGARQVRLELHRQGAAIPLEARPKDLALDLAQPPAGASQRVSTSALVTSAKVTAERENDAWFNRILDTAVRLRRTGLQGDALQQRLVDTLEADVDTGTLRTAKAEVHEAFSVGRATEASELSDEIDLVEYSALLDVDTCGPCEALDGEQFPYDSPRYYETMPPYKDCEGNKGMPDACRCVHLFLFKDRTK